MGTNAQKFCLTIVSLAISAGALALPDIQVNGLFSDRAMFTIEGNTQLLRAGETSAEGVTLISATTDEAVIEYEGSEHRLTLSSRIGASFQQQTKEVRLPPGFGGHYMVKVNINGRTIDAMVDTGATLVAMNSRHAEQLRLNLDYATDGYASTAGGMISTKSIVLRSVSLGGLTRNSVQASVTEGDFPEIVLLGNSFLSGFDMEIQSGVLVLQSKF